MTRETVEYFLSKLRIHHGALVDATLLHFSIEELTKRLRERLSWPPFVKTLPQVLEKLLRADSTNSRLNVRANS